MAGIPKIVAVFVVFWSLLSQFLCHFLLVSPYFLLFHDILEPQNSPPNEVTGYYIYIHTKSICMYVNIYVCMHCRDRIRGHFWAFKK